MVNQCVILYPIRDNGKHELGFIIGGARHSNGNRADDGSELIVDPVRKFAQQQRCFKKKCRSRGFHRLLLLKHRDGVPFTPAASTGDVDGQLLCTGCSYLLVYLKNHAGLCASAPMAPAGVTVPGLWTTLLM